MAPWIHPPTPVSCSIAEVRERNHRVPWETQSSDTLEVLIVQEIDEGCNAQMEGWWETHATGKVSITALLLQRSFFSFFSLTLTWLHE